MARYGVAQGEKKIVARRETLAFLDQSGISMNPYVRRTWAPVGKTPKLVHRATWSGISMMGAITLAPLRRRTSVYVRLYPKRAVRGLDVAGFLRELLKTRRGNLCVLLDRANIHRASAVRELVSKTKRLRIVYLPPYAPDLNPIEWLWGHLKTRALANYCAPDIEDLGDQVLSEVERARMKPSLLRAFIRASELPALV